jgi:hypothetical protein
MSKLSLKINCSQVNSISYLAQSLIEPKSESQVVSLSATPLPQRITTPEPALLPEAGAHLRLQLQAAIGSDFHFC